jgi:SdiA-regulated
MRFGARTIVFTALSAIAGAAAPVNDGATVSAYLRQTPAKQFYLPEGLSEVSGLAVASKNSVYAHDDNFAIVYEVDLSSAKTLKAFALGNPTVKADFEDIAVRDGYVYLLTSDGRLFEAPVGENRKRVLYNAYDTGVGVHCETEGLAIGPAEGDFLILCKKPHEVGFKDRLVVYIWNLRDRRPVATPWLNVSLDGLVEKLDQANFHPSAFAWRRDRGTLIVVSAKGHSTIEIDQQGRLVDSFKLDKERHPQPEGLTIMPDGRLILGDEGPPGHGKITVYNAPR